MIPVTKPYLPCREKLDKYLDGIYERQWLTNNGQLVQELTRRLEDYLGVENLLLVANGTLALQIAYRALNVSGDMAGERPEAITTPFTFVATASSLKWDGVEPVFADIDPDSWCLDPANIEDKITPNTRAIVPVHVFGNACNVEAIDTISRKHRLKVIYDASHAFGVTYRGESLLKHGDAATLSFHATKLFHTGEGGAIIFKRKEDLERAKKMINFGITGAETIEELGINAKLSEFQAAVGLCVLEDLNNALTRRSSVWHSYEEKLKNHAKLQERHPEASNNHAYFPIVLENEGQVKESLKKLNASNIMARRYFTPSLDQIKNVFDKKAHKKTSGKISSSIICLPLYGELTEEQTDFIAGQIIEATCHA